MEKPTRSLSFRVVVTVGSLFILTSDAFIPSGGRTSPISVPQSLSKSSDVTREQDDFDKLASRLDHLKDFTEKIEALGALKEPTVPISIEPVPEQYQQILDAQTRNAQLNLAYHIFKPFVLAVLIGIAMALRTSPVAGAFVCTLAAVVALDLWKDEVWMVALGQPQRYQIKAGVYMDRNTSVAAAIEACGFEGPNWNYRAPWFLPSGDWTTLFPVLSPNPPASPESTLEYIRYYLPVSGGETLAVDLALPSGGVDPAAPVVLVAAGIGGGPGAPYVREAAAALVARGWAVAALVPKGMQDHRVADLGRHKGVDQVGDLADVHAAVRALSAASPRVLLLGFSLGGNQVANYLSRYGPAVPREVKGALAVSGALRHRYAGWGRYQRVYQRLVVPGLLSDFLSKYAPALEEALGGAAGLARACRARTYEELHGSLLAPLRAAAGAGPPGEAFGRWVAETEAAFDGAEALALAGRGGFPFVMAVMGQYFDAVLSLAAQEDSFQE